MAELMERHILKLVPTGTILGPTEKVLQWTASLFLHVGHSSFLLFATASTTFNVALKNSQGQGVMSGDMTEPFQFLPLECSKQRLLGTHQTGDDTSDKFVRPLLFVGDRTVC